MLKTEAIAAGGAEGQRPQPDEDSKLRGTIIRRLKLLTALFVVMPTHYLIIWKYVIQYKFLFCFDVYNLNVLFAHQNLILDSTTFFFSQLFAFNLLCIICLCYLLHNICLFGIWRVVVRKPKKTCQNIEEIFYFLIALSNP